MIQRLSVLGLFFSILVSAENSTTVTNNALSHKPIITDSDNFAIKMKTIFLNKIFSNFDSNVHNANRTKKLNLINSSGMTYDRPISRSSKGTKLKYFHHNNRFRRQVNNINTYKNNKGDTAERYIKILLDLQPENEEDIYDYYDSQKDYHDHQEKHISGLMEDRILNKEIENNSKLLTRTLNESQERKRCTKNNMENIGPKKLQLSQPLILENIEDRKKLNMDSAELTNGYNHNSGLKKKNDDYFINILNQLIDKLNKSKESKSTHIKDLLSRKSNEPISLENKAVEGRTTNSSSEEELILRLEKIKGNRIIDKLNSSPETTFVNGKWVRNKLQENKHNDLKPVDLRSEFNYTDEPISTNDLKQFNLTDPENQVIDTKGDILENFDNLQISSTQETKEISTSPLPGENENFLVSRATTKPIYLTSTVEDKLDSTMVDENDTSQFMTNHTEEFNNEENNTNYETLYESTLNSFHTTPKYEPNKELPFDLNNTLQTKKLERILESSVNENNSSPKTNYFEELTTDGDLSLAERENESSENNVYCNCKKKVVKNILSSTMIQNITEIKTNSYVSPNNLKMNSHKRPDKLQKTNIISKNITGNRVSNKNKKDLISDLLLKNQVITEKPTKRKRTGPKVNKLQKSTLDLDDKTNKSMKTVPNTFLQNYLTPKIHQLQSNGQKKRNNDEKNDKAIGIQKSKISLIPKNSQNKNPRQFVVPSKQYVPKNEDYTRSNTEEYYNVDDITENKKVSTLSKSLNKIPNKITSRIPFRNLPGPFKENANHESTSRKYPENVIIKLKHKVPINAKEQNVPRNSGGYHNIDDATTPITAFNSPKSWSQIPKKINTKSTPNLMSKYLEKVHNRDVDATKHKPSKFNTESHKYTPFNQNPYIDNTKRKNIYNDSPKNSKIIDSLDLAKSRRPLKLVENNGRANVINIPKYRYNDDEKVDSKDIPTYSENSDGQNIETNNKVSKFSSPPGTRPMNNNESGSTSKLKKPFTDAKTKSGLKPSVPNRKTPITNNRPFLKKQNTESDRPPPTQSLFVRKTDPTKNAAFQYDADSRFSLTPKVWKTSDEDSPRDHAEHAPYRHEDLEPIVFDRPTDEPDKNRAESAFRNPPGRQSARPQNTRGFEPSRSTQASRPPHDDFDDYDGARRRSDDDGGADGEKHTSNDGPAENDGHAEDDDGSVFKTGSDDNGPAYVSDVHVPPPSSAPKDRTSPSCGATVLRAAEPSDDGRTAPVHIIQIINNGLCPDKRAGNGTAEKSRKFRNGGESVLSSAARSNDAVADGRQRSRKLGNAYDHFDSDILDRFLQVYAPPPIV